MESPVHLSYYIKFSCCREKTHTGQCQKGWLIHRVYPVYSCYTVHSHEHDPSLETGDKQVQIMHQEHYNQQSMHWNHEQWERSHGKLLTAVANLTCSPVNHVCRPGYHHYIPAPTRSPILGAQMEAFLFSFWHPLWATQPVCCSLFLISCHIYFPPRSILHTAGLVELDLQGYTTLYSGVTAAAAFI